MTTTNDILVDVEFFNSWDCSGQVTTPEGTFEWYVYLGEIKIEAGDEDMPPEVYKAISKEIQKAEEGHYP